MREFKGSYLGISPTDESAIATGEIEMIIRDNDATIRHATGLTIMEETLPLDVFRPMSEEEIFPDGRKEQSGIMNRGFTTKDEGGVKVIFTVNPKLGEFDVFIRRGEMADILGPTILWSRRRILHIILLKMSLAFANIKHKGGVPRLAHGGRIKGIR